MGRARPTFGQMRSLYEDYRADTMPCKYPGIENQCAVRMSLALVRNGFSLDNFPEQRRIHRGRSQCVVEDDHIVGADELHQYLVRVWDAGLRGTGSAILPQISGTPGIIYFNNCFHRSADAEGSNRGDHIDLWDGENYYNQILQVSAGGGTAVQSDLFATADYVRFFWLPS